MATARNLNERNAMSNTGRAVQFAFREENGRPETPRSRARGEKVGLRGGESAARTAAFCRVIYARASAPKCRNKIGAHSEMNSRLCVTAE